MKKPIFGMVLLCCASLLILAMPAAGETLSGWISDSKCGTKGADASHAACAKKCIGMGEKPVLVTDKDQKVVSVDNPDAVKDHAGEHVQVNGKMANGELHVTSVKTLSQ
jgi:hypothetical protein